MTSKTYGTAEFLLRQRGYIEVVGQGIRPTRKFVTDYRVSMNKIGRLRREYLHRGGQIEEPTSDIALVDTIDQSGPASEEERTYMFHLMKLLIQKTEHSMRRKLA